MIIPTNKIEHNIYHHLDIFISPVSWIDTNVDVGGGSKIWHFSVLRENVRIGSNSVIGHNVVVERDTIIGNNTTIQSQCHITAEAIIGDNVFFGPGVVTMNEKKIANLGRREQKIEHLIVEDGARIGAGTVIAPGVKIGKNAFVQAGCFLTSDVPEGEMWGCRNGFVKAVRLGDVPKEEWL